MADFRERTLQCVVLCVRGNGVFQNKAKLLNKSNLPIKEMSRLRIDGIPEIAVQDYSCV